MRSSVREKTRHEFAPGCAAIDRQGKARRGARLSVVRDQLAAVSNWHASRVGPGFMLEETKNPPSFSELISMMNRKLAHGRHVEWVSRAKGCGAALPGQRSEGKPAQRSPNPDLNRPSGFRQHSAYESSTSVADLATDGKWPDSATAAA